MIRETIDEASGGRYRFSVGSSPDINYYSNGGSDDWVRGEGRDKYFLQGHSTMAKSGWVTGNARRCLTFLRFWKNGLEFFLICVYTLNIQHSAVFFCSHLPDWE